MDETSTNRARQQSAERPTPKSTGVGLCVVGLLLVVVGAGAALWLPGQLDRRRAANLQWMVVKRLSAVAEVVGDPRWTTRVVGSFTSADTDVGASTEMAALSRHTRTAVVLSNGERLLAGAGAAEARARLGALVGREGDGETRLLAPEGDWGAVGIKVAPRLWLWALADARSEARAGLVARAREHTVTWAASGSSGLLGLILFTIGIVQVRRAFRPYGEHASADDVPSLPPVLDGRLTPAAFTARVPIDPDKLEGFGLTLGRYTVVSRLGEGGMAEICNAVCHGPAGFRRRFVVKRLRPELAANPDAVAQFIDEARLAATLVHSNVLTVLDFGQAGSEYFMATEHIQGRDLRQITVRLLEQSERPLDINLVIGILGELLKALAFVHEKTDGAGRPLELVHRDVSPNNVLVSSSGEIKLLDFGIVKARDRRFSTRAGTVKGNPLFMSPEQARGLGMDHRSDLFSVGLLTFYMATGSTLYQGSSDYEVLTRAAHGPGEGDFAIIDGLPEPLCTILPRALAIDPRDRYADAREFRAALHPFLMDPGPALATLMDTLYHGEFLQDEQAFAALVNALEDGRLALQLGPHMRKSTAASGA